MHLFLSAAHKSSGKTTITLGLVELFRRKGLIVAPCKKGPDYIDPIWLSIAANKACKNLDTFISTEEEVISDFLDCINESDLTLIEGNKGLYDGVALDGSNSNAAVAKLLNTPVILVIDCRGITRGIAPLLLGYKLFDPDVQIAGVILNRVGGKRHESKLRASVEHYTDIPVLGAVYNNDDLNIDETHLGLIPGNELPEANQKIQTIADQIGQSIELDKVIDIALAAKLPKSMATEKKHYSKSPNPTTLRIGIAKDQAFGFYYPNDLEEFEKNGATLVEFNTLTDGSLPDNLDALFFGGGFPERHAQTLSDNSNLRKYIRDQIKNGLPSYAECGGLMYLSSGITWNSVRYEMVGAIDVETTMHEKPQGRGYVILEHTKRHPWHQKKIDSLPVHAHEFHYSRIESLPNSLDFAFTMRRGTGINEKHDGIIINNLLASYTHMRHTKNNPWVHNFLSFVRKCK